MICAGEFISAYLVYKGDCFIILSSWDFTSLSLKGLVSLLLKEGIVYTLNFKDLKGDYCLYDLYVRVSRYIWLWSKVWSEEICSSCNLGFKLLFYDGWTSLDSWETSSIYIVLPPDLKWPLGGSNIASSVFAEDHYIFSIGFRCTLSMTWLGGIAPISGSVLFLLFWAELFYRLVLIISLKVGFGLN